MFFMVCLSFKLGFTPNVSHLGAAQQTINTTPTDYHFIQMYAQTCKQ